VPKKGYGLRSEYAAVLSSISFARWWDRFIEGLEEVVEEDLSEEERDKLLRSREALEKWVLEQAKGLFKYMLEYYDVDDIVVLYDYDKVMYIPHYKEEKFLLISQKLGHIDDAVERLTEKLKDLERGITREL